MRSKVPSRPWQPVAVAFYGTPAGRFPAHDFIESLVANVRAEIHLDTAAFAFRGDGAPVSWKWIKGHTPMRELRIGQIRVFFVVKSGSMIVLEACKKQNQDAAIERAAARMKEI